MISQAAWEQVIDRNGFRQVTQGTETKDPFSLLAQRAAAAPSSAGKVTMSVGNAADYSQVKVSVTLTIPVSMNEYDISLAGEAGFMKAREMVNEASAALGLEPLR